MSLLSGEYSTTELSSKLHPAYNPSAQTMYKTQSFYCSSTVAAETSLPHHCVAAAAARATENTASNSSSDVVCWFVAMRTCLSAIAT
jgi:hypothetical protein